MLRISTLSLLLTLVASAEVLHNGIAMPAAWPPQQLPTQAYRVPSYLTAPPAVIPINVGRQLFVDDFLIENTTLTRTQHRPVPYSGNPVLRTSLNGDVSMPFSDGVWFDPADRLFKMWYFGPKYSPYLCYAYSYDGKNWIKPVLANAAVKNTNYVINFGGGRDSGTVWMDLEDPNPARKFKGFFYGGSGLLRVFYSPDGIVWTEQPFKINSLSDRTTLFWNPFRKVWVESARSGATLPATSTRPATSARARYYLESTDLQTWLPSNSAYAFWTSADEKDPAYPGTSTLPHLYNLDAVAYESVFVGLFSMYYPEPAPLLVELNAGFSRDGYQWVRPTRGAADKAFIPATNRDGDWNAFNTQSVGGGFLVVGDELWFYYSGRSGRHGTAFNTHQMQTGLSTLRRDGFYSMDAPGGEGTLTTRKVKFTGTQMFVNVNAPSGSLQVEVLDESGTPIPGFTRAESTPYSGNSTKQLMKWSGRSDLSSLVGRNVRFRFFLTRGELYAFWVTPDSNGASYGYVAAGGPGFVSNRDTGDALPPEEDKTAPSVPTGLTAAATPTSVQLNWSASTDNVAVTGYRVFRNGSPVGTVSGTSWTDTAVSSGANYSYTVSATDAAGNASSQSAPATATIPAAPDTTAPTVPSGLSATVTTVPSVQLIWTPSTDNVRVTGYRVLRNGALVATVATTVWVDPSVTASTTYTYSVLAMDAAGNTSAAAVATATIPGPVIPPPVVNPPPPPTTALSYIKVEAESVTISRPFQQLYMGPLNCSNGYFIRGTTNNTGSLTYTVNVPTAGTYTLWGRGSSSSSGGSFYVSMDGGAETLWSTPGWVYGSWSWLRAASFNLTAGTHKLTLRAGVSYTYLDVMMLTNDAAFVPTGLSGK